MLKRKQLKIVTKNDKSPASRRTYEPDVSEQQRLVVAATVLGSVIALYSLGITSADLWSVTRGFALFPGIFAFLYIISTGAHLKYDEAGLLGDIEIAHSVRKFFYNWMVNMFSTGLLLSVILFAAAFFGWDGKTMSGSSFWVGAVVGMLIMLCLMVLSIFVANHERKKES